jgi:hypothetical protein
MSTKRLSKDEVIALALRCANRFKEPAFEESLYQKVQGRGMIVGPQLMERLDEIHIEQMNDWGFDGRDVLHQLQFAAKTSPGEDTKAAIIALCDSTEVVLKKVTARVAKDNNVELPAEGATPMPQVSPQQMMLMQMAIKNLSEQQRQDMMSIQQKMMSGQQLTPADQQRMMEIQRSIMTYTATMGPLLAQMQAGQSAAAASAQQPPKQ